MGMDPLTLLREYTTSRELDKVEMTRDECVFGGEHRFPRTMETAYKKRDGGRYTVETLVFFVKNLEGKHVNYLKLAMAAQVPIVNFTDRQLLLDYLQGRVSASDNIEPLDHSTAPSALPGHSSAAKGPTGLQSDAFGDEGREAKRFRASGNEGPGRSQSGIPSQATERIPMDYELLKILSKERPLRSFEAMFLCSKKADIFSGVIKTVKEWEQKKKQEELQTMEAKRQAEKAALAAKKSSSDAKRHSKPLSSKPGSAPPPPPSAPPPPLPLPPIGGPGMTAHKDDEKQHWKAYMGSDAAEALGIDPTQSYMTSTTPADALLPPPPPAPALLPPPPPEAPNGKPLLLPPPPSSSKPHSSQDKHKSSSSQHRSSSHHSSVPRPVSSHSHSHRSSSSTGCPVILVPSATQTLVNMFNAKEFLQDGKFVNSEPKIMAGEMKPDVLQFQRKMGRDKPVTYEIRDKIPPNFSKKDWDRVVAVFVLGKEWQFKGWPFKDPVEALSRLMGVYVRYEDDSLDSTKVVSQWNCFIISLSRHKRHQDATNVLTFWQKLDSHLRSRKSSLAF